jgi:two-component system sensor histidine kinase KdpD
MTRLPPRPDAAFFPILLAVLSHELGSPLAAIKGAATTLFEYRARLPAESIDGFLQSIDTQTDRLDGLLNDLAILAKIEIGTLLLWPEPVGLRRLLDQIVADLPPEQRGAFAVEGEDAYVMVDPSYLRQALTLLLPYTRTSQPVILRVATLSSIAQIALTGLVDPDLADPLGRLNDVIRSTDSNRSPRAAALLRPALSRALIEWQGGHWAMDSNGHAVPALRLTLPLATPEQLAKEV